MCLKNTSQKRYTFHSCREQKEKCLKTTSQKKQYIPLMPGTKREVFEKHISKKAIHSTHAGNKKRSV